MASKKKKKSANKNKGGRPPVVTDAVVGKLELGFRAGLNKTECCEFAGISRTALYDYIDRTPGFADKIEELRSHPSAQAKLNISLRIDKGDIELSQWYLERKNRDEFSLKQQVDTTVTVTKLEDLL